MDAHSEFVFYRTYARWLEQEKRRETFPEAVERYVSFLERQPKSNLVPKKVFRKIRQYMLSMDVVGSMRLFWTAGAAADASNVCGYNCSFIALSSVSDFAELVYILMCGCGVGFSVEDRYISLLPTIPMYEYNRPVSQITIPDTKEGWADSIKHLMTNLYLGVDTEFDYTLLRPRGSPLKTMGGTSSGSIPLSQAHTFIRDTFREAQGRKLLDIEAHDICCQLAEMVICGGVRRSATISLSDLDSDSMRKAKEGFNFPLRRYMANNSWVARQKPEALTFIKEWGALISSGSGERGIINLTGLPEDLIGVNPCAEILLKDHQFCNLSEVVVRPDDDIESLIKKVETATWIGVLQGTLTNFPYLRPTWKEHTEQDNLLGVSLTGQMDNTKTLSPINLQVLRKKARKTANKAANILGINPAARITCGKPSGTTSQLMHCGSGCHTWWDKFMIRRYRVSADSPITALLKYHNVPLIPENGQEHSENPTIYVVEFPLAAPEGAITRHQTTAIQQLEWYKHIQTNWCDHNQSCTIYVKEDEWMEVGAWVYKNWDIVRGVSFLPDLGGNYKLAPIESITEEEYLLRKANFPVIDYSKLHLFEYTDKTEGAKTFACVGDKCNL